VHSDLHPRFQFRESSMNRRRYVCLRFALFVIGLWTLGGSVAPALQVDTASRVPAMQRLSPDTTAAQSAPESDVPESNVSALSSSAREQIRIGSGDLLEISVYGTDFSKTVRVASSGHVKLPLIGELRLAGLTTGQAEAAIRKMLMEGNYFNNPEVSVFAREYATQGISVLGEVQKPGVYALLGSRTLLDVISVAGGTTPRAGKFVSITHRDNPREPVTIELSRDPEKPMPNNVQVFPGDTIEVLKAPIVYVVGDVHLPGGFIVENGKQLTVLQAVAMAQGTNPTAALDRARIIRQSSIGRQDIPIALRQILAAKAADTPLQPDDIVFVPSSTAKGAARRGLEAILQTATGVAIYRR
jgi:polysaccharide biosynthesis/export protein